MSTTTKKFNAWKADFKSAPIPNTDKVYIGKSKRAVLEHIAYLEGVKLNHNDMVVNLADGTKWCVMPSTWFEK